MNAHRAFCILGLAALAMLAWAHPLSAADAFAAVEAAVGKTLPGKGETCRIQFDIKTVKTFKDNKDAEVKTSSVSGGWWARPSGQAVESLLRFESGDYQNMGMLIKPGKNGDVPEMLVFLPSQGRTMAWTKWSNAFVESHFNYEDLLPEKAALWTYSTAPSEDGCTVVSAVPVKLKNPSAYDERRIFINGSGVIAKIQYLKGPAGKARVVKQAVFEYESAGGATRPAKIVMTLPESGSSTTWTFSDRKFEDIPGEYFDEKKLAEDKKVQEFRKKLAEIRAKIDTTRKEIEDLRKQSGGTPSGN